MITTNQTMTMEKLSKIKVKRPDNAGEYWQGVVHYELLWNILNCIDTLNLNVFDQQWIVDEARTALALNKNKSDIVAGLEIFVPDINLPDKMIPSLGIINSNSMRSSLKLYVGIVTKPENNGIVIASPSLKIKHTIHLDLEDTAETIVTIFQQALIRAPKYIEVLKAKKLSTNEVCSLLVEAGSKQIMPWSRVGQVNHKITRLSNPFLSGRLARAAVLKVKKWTAWDILNAFSNITKQSPPFNQLEMLNRFRKLLQRY